MSKKKPVFDDPAAPARLSSFADVLAQRGVSVSPASTTQPDSPTPSSDPHVPLTLAGCGKLIIRRERKGHGGKTVTVIEGLSLRSSDLEKLARELRKALGCGASAADGRVIVQGDTAQRVEGWLRGHGAKTVARGN